MSDNKKNDLNTIYQDNDILVLDKPAGLVVEKDGDKEGTLEYILKDDFDIDLPRSGIVHRLDRDTSGIMVVAKNEKSQVSLQNQFASKDIKKTYHTLVFGDLSPEKGEINIALKRDQKNRTRFMASRLTSGQAGSNATREAITKYRVLEKQKNTSFLEVNLITGRTHQIRAHFLAIGYPVVGDQVYHNQGSYDFSKKLGLNRQFLHAYRIEFTHPVTGKKVRFKSKLSEDLEKILGKIKK